MGQQLISLLISYINKSLNIHIKQEDILMLDSTSESKFSVHLIFTNLVFADNHQTGKFVNNFLLSLDYKTSSLFRGKKGEEDTLSIDTGVYTKNKNFRLFLSSKFGRKQIFDVSEHDLFTRSILERHRVIEKDNIFSISGYICTRSASY